MSDFYTDVVMKDWRFKSIDRVPVATADIAGTGIFKRP